MELREAFAPVREGDEVLLYLDVSEEDGDLPTRRLYWFHAVPGGSSWEVRVPADRFDSWLAQSVPAEREAFPGDKGQWRLATRFAQVRHRGSPTDALGVSPPVLGTVSFRRLEP